VIERSNNGEYSSLSLGLKSNAIMNKFTRKENLAFPEAINTINNYDHSPTNLLRDVGRQQLDMGNFQPHSQM
jgi:hypothetical protein